MSAARRSTLKRRVIPDPPEMDPAAGDRARRFFVLAVLVAAACCLAAIALNVYADPYGAVGTHILPTVTTSDRTVKADRVEQLPAPPQLVVLGSSRSMRYEPAYLRQKTGLRTFNGGVNGIGGTGDAYAMARFIAEVWPGSRPAYLWLVDVESFVPFKIGNRTANEPRLAKYLGQATARKGLGELLRAAWENRDVLFSLKTTKDSVRLLLFREKAKSKQSRYRRQILADGVLKERPWTAKEWERRFPNSVERYTALYATVYHNLDPAAQAWFERGLDFMNRRGARPVVVLTPINPKLRRLLAPLGWEERHRQVVRYILGLRRRYDFVFLDLTDPRRFGYDPREWYDGVHMTTVNTRRAIDWILAHSGGIPPQAPAGRE